MTKRIEVPPNRLELPPGLRPPLLAAERYKNNAEVIAAVFELGWITEKMTFLDVTYGRGKWWDIVRPPQLAWHDIDTLHGGDGVSYLALPEDDGSIDVVAYDPPYAPHGGLDTSGIPDHLDRYGRDVAGMAVAAVQADIEGGLAESCRVARMFVLVKCCDYVWSDKLRMGTFWTLQAIEALGMTVVDRAQLVTSGGPQAKLSVCLHCTRPLMKRADGRWSDRRRSKEVDKFQCDGQPGRHPHTPNFDVPTQHHFVNNSSFLYVCQVPKPTSPQGTLVAA